MIEKSLLAEAQADVEEQAKMGMYWSAAQIAAFLGCGETKARELKNRCNEELEARGFFVPFKSKTSARYLKERLGLA